MLISTVATMIVVVLAMLIVVAMVTRNVGVVILRRQLSYGA